MIWISFARWNSKHGRLFSRWWIYLDGRRWTPLVWVTPRYGIKRWTMVIPAQTEDEDGQQKEQPEDTAQS